MATLSTIVDNGDLIRIEIELDGDDQLWRLLYATPDFIEWLDQVLPRLKTNILGLDFSPMEQVDSIFESFACGRSLNSDRRFKKLRRTPDGFVWELKTPDIRIFGWFLAKDQFVCTFGVEKDHLELTNGYGRYIAQTMFIREQVDLDPPKHIEGSEYNDVLSDAPVKKK